MSDLKNNPFFNEFKTPHDALPFDRVKTEDFLPALEEALKIGRENIKKIKHLSEEPNFENTIFGLDVATEKSDIVAETFFNLLSSHSNEKMHALAKEISPKLAELSNDIILDETLFKRVKAVWDKRESDKLSQEQKKFVEKTYKSFIRNGANLEGAAKEKLRAIDQELSKLSPDFSERNLKATYAWEMLLTQKEDLAGLPESSREAAAQAAKLKGKEGWLITLEVPSAGPFLTYAERRDLREKLWRKLNSRCYGDEFDNQQNILKIVGLRNQRAQLLGFKTHADYVLEERMAKTTDKVMSFLTNLSQKALPAAKKEIEEVRALKKQLSGDDSLMPWDMAFYSEKLKEQKYKFNEEELRPYFKLENVVQGIFEHAKKLYNLEFKEAKNVPVYHADVRAYEVFDSKKNTFVGLFYTDFFPRPSKRGGAWMTPLREQGYFDGMVRRPHVSIVCNFTKPTETKPSLLTLNEVLTLFHEFGHALHGLLSECHYRSVAGTNVYWDFVELPSQIMENWVKEKEGLDLFARHYETGEKIPKELAQKIKESSQFQAAYAMMRQLNYSLIDMKWHTSDPGQIKDVVAFETEVTQKTQLLPRVEGSCMSCTFSHIFAGGYSAGYYSYKWAEVLEADAFEFFKEKGIFNQEVAESFRKNILSRGGTEHPMELYKNFRGREPDAEALLRRDGLI